jgi:hypothetical protein
MLGMGGHPAIRQQGLQGSHVARVDGGNPLLGRFAKIPVEEFLDQLAVLRTVETWACRAASTRSAWP